MAHFAFCKNDTTARSMTSAGSRIEVSFVVVDPPGLTRCAVHFPDMKISASTPASCVIGADGAFLLISVIFPERDGQWMITDVFVYRAGPGTPSLCLLPRPYPVGLFSNYAGVLSCGKDCLVVIPEQRIEADEAGRMVFDFHVLSTETMSWSTKVAKLSCDLVRYDSEFEPTKVFSIGGGSLAWVDLRYSILLCDDMLGDYPDIRMIQLPPLMPANKVNFRVGLDGTVPPLDPIRDVTFRDGGFCLIEMEFPESGVSNNAFLRWTATMFKRMLCSEDWQQCYTVDSLNFSPADSCFPYLFAEIWDCNEKRLTLNNVVSSNPTLDLYQDDVVYMISKLKADDLNGWVLAINTKHMKLERIVPFSAESLYFHRTYLQCTFSKYLCKAPDTHLIKPLEKSTNRRKIELLDSSLVAALEQLKDIEIHMESLNRRYNLSVPLLCSGPASSSDQCVLTTAEDGLDNGRDKYVSHAMDEYLRAVRDLELHISAPIDAAKNKIRVAHGSLYNLMRTLPSDVLDEEFME